MIPPILGPHLAEQKALIASLAKEPGAVLITGEEGVGKTLFARHLHAASSHACSILPLVNLATLSEREGRLALLGADFEKLTSTKRSLLELSGPVLIQHINAASLALQEALADALRTGHFLRPGSIKHARVKCRPFFTLRCTLKELLRNKSLSNSLCAILATARTIHIPPLRERPDDISAIARNALGRDLSPRLEENLRAYSWPGNVRELKAYLVCIRPFTGRGTSPDACLLEVAKLRLGIDEEMHLSMKEAIARIEGTFIAHALRRTGGHQERAARLLGLTSKALRWHLARERKDN